MESDPPLISRIPASEDVNGAPFSRVSFKMYLVAGDANACIPDGGSCQMLKSYGTPALRIGLRGYEKARTRWKAPFSI